ncbi:outer membrane beta-barrel protein [Sphingobium aquiterrae]|uniref:outer membrane beta-barrel protein n=1 Tax=Sphingobium aquiterrae TaxID=2038656 RepID=UPI0030175A37
MKKRNLSFLLGSLACCYASSAHAQSETLLVQPSLPDDFDRGRNISVQQRARPDYDPIGIRSGAFNIFPQVETSLAYSDNVYYSDNNTVSDGSITVAPSVQVVSDWSRHQLRLRGNARLTRYFDETLRNQNPWNLGALGRVDVGDTLRFIPEVQLAREFENPFSGETTADQSALSNYLRAYGSLRTEYSSGQTKLTLSVDDTNYDFSTIELRSGTIRDQSDRDRNIFRVTGQAQYAFTPSMAAFAQLGYRKTDYPHLLLNGDANRDSDSWVIIGGVNFDLSALMRGTIGVGYIRRSYDSPLYRNVDGFSAEAKVEYFPTELTTVTLAARRTIEDSFITTTSGYFDNRASLRIDHELLRNLILSAMGEYAKQDYIGSKQKVDVYRITGSGTYLASNWMSFSLNLAYTGRSANDIALGQDFNEFRGQVGVTFKR